MGGTEQGPAREIARLVRATGRVQGVGFRWHTRLEARALGAVGWVQNLEDGDVEAHIQGAPAAVRGLLEWMERGPSGAVVESLTTIDAVPSPDLPTFEVRR